MSSVPAAIESRGFHLGQLPVLDFSSSLDPRCKSKKNQDKWKDGKPSSVPDWDISPLAVISYKS